MPPLKHSFRKHKWQWIIALLVIAAGTWLALANRESLNREAIMEYGEALPAVWLVVAFAVLPMLGFPVSILLVLLGVRFGLGHGMAVCAAGIAFHHLAAFFSVHGALRQRIRGKIRTWGHQVPEIGARNPAWFTFWFAAIHGPPYTLKIYLLALTDIPFRIYFWVGAPVYLGFSVIAIAAGAAITTFDPTWFYILITLIAFAAIGTSLVRSRMKKRIGPPDRT